MLPSHPGEHVLTGGLLSECLRYWPNCSDTIFKGHSKSGNHTLGKPVVVSETGAGGIYEWSDNKTDAKWTLNYQTEIISEDVKAVLSDVKYSGMTIWHLFDFKTYDHDEDNTACDYEPNVFPPICSFIDANPSDLSNRPGGANHKGVVDFWRRPKPILDIVAGMYNASQHPSSSRH